LVANATSESPRPASPDLPLRLRCRLQILVGHAEICVPQVIADRQLMFAPVPLAALLRLAERVPADSPDPKLLKRRPDLFSRPPPDREPFDQGTGRQGTPSR